MLDSRTIQVAPEHYRESYDHRRRFLSYWNQIDQVRKARPENLLEVGIGNGFVTRYLREQGYQTHTVDFDERLRPDTVASVLNLPFADDSFDVVCSFETLEHLPWESFVPALAELARVSRRKVLISLPDVSPYFNLRFGYKFRENLLEWAFDLPKFRSKPHRFDGQHYWEIGKRGFLLADIKAGLRKAGLKVLTTHRDYEDPFHRFFETEPR